MTPKPCPPKLLPPCSPRQKQPCSSNDQDEDCSSNDLMSSGQVSSGSKGEKCFEIWHPGFDARFPNGNMARRCWYNFVDFYRCQSRLGEDDTRCEYYKKTFLSICPDFWVEKWEEQRENGTFPASLD